MTASSLAIEEKNILALFLLLVDTVQKIPVLLQVFVLPFIRGKAVAKEISTNSSMAQLG